MKKLISFILTITLLFVLTSCGGKNKDNGKQGDLYFDYTGIAETTHIAYTSEETFDLKTVFKVGPKTSSYNDKKIGETTYDDIYFYIYKNFSSDVDVLETDDAKINPDGTITRKRLSTVVVYAALKEEPDVSEEDKYNGGMHILTLFFGNDKTFGTWEAENEYLDVWIQSKIDDGETDAKKATMTLEFRSDFTYTITITEGYFGTTYDNKLSAKTITGKLYGLVSDGANRYDDGDHNYYDFTIEMNSYYYMEEEKYSLFTGIKIDENSNTYHNYRFLPKESN